ncbi:hypothetical protein CHS0354_031491 [Potamilus streckersoni]|uniref:Uncharacterized protein n=1 Tax=Potamilus streckersoni TaxID=2493646 RepID=A0AAE0SHE6_9BIVA|nr:hypothetical protein CHS0354_031491 [Potamilus streckersoni]
MNRPDPPITVLIPEVEYDLDIIMKDDITYTKIREAIKTLKNGKAPTDDIIYSEMFKTERRKTGIIAILPIRMTLENEATGESSFCYPSLASSSPE